MVRKEARPPSILAPVFSFPRGLEQFGISSLPETPPQPRMTQTPKSRSAPPPAAAKPPSAAARTARGGDRPPSEPGKARRLTVLISPSEYETLGLVAVKKSVTRHQLVRNALDEYLALLVDEYGAGCQCIYTGCSCGKTV